MFLTKNVEKGDHKRQKPPPEALKSTPEAPKSTPEASQRPLKNMSANFLQKGDKKCPKRGQRVPKWTSKSSTIVKKCSQKSYRDATSKKTENN